MTAYVAQTFLLLFAAYFMGSVTGFWLRGRLQGADAGGQGHATPTAKVSPSRGPVRKKPAVKRGRPRSRRKK